MECEEVAAYHRDYRVLRQIANGAFGSVHCVQRRDTKVILAAKYMKSRVEDVAREVNALLHCSNSSLILQLMAYYVNESGGRQQSILVTEFLAGGDLFERVAPDSYGLNENKVRTIVRQICRGVRFIHSRNFIHLDLKPFNIVFSQKKDDYDLRIIDFGLARQLGAQGQSVPTGMCGTIEYMSPEVMNCSFASTASDCWGIGVIAYQLLSGGCSPFFAVSRFRTMAKVLDCNYALDAAELSKVSDEAKDFISRLLITNPKERLSAHQCLEHKWLRDDQLYLGILETLETKWMRRCLARRRWYRLLNAVRVMTTISRPANVSEIDDDKIDDDDDEIDDDDKLDDDDEKDADNANVEVDDVDGVDVVRVPRGLPLGDLSSYSGSFDKLHLLLNNGSMGTVYCVQHRVSSEVYAAKHLRHCRDRARREASILHRLRGSSAVATLNGLYEGPRLSVIVTEFLVGGDLVERTARSDFVLNEAKCRLIVRQICSALDFAHRFRILHLNLRPCNILFKSREDNDIQVAIADFSCAKMIETETMELNNVAIDTMMYVLVEFMAPEMLEARLASDKTDCWGIGVIAFMLVSGGQSPFYGGNRFRTMAKILACQYAWDAPQLALISSEAKSFVRSLLILDPSQRMSAGQCIAHPWLTEEALQTDLLIELETSWMRRLLARRRWQRWFNAVRATQRMRKLSQRALQGSNALAHQRNGNQQSNQND